MKDPRWLADHLRAALEQQTPDVLPGLLRATYLPPSPSLTQRSPRRRRGHILTVCAVLTVGIFSSLSLSGKTHVSGHAFRLPSYCEDASQSVCDMDTNRTEEEAYIPLRESGVVMGTYGSEGTAEYEECVILTEVENSVLAPVPEEMWTGEIGVRTAAGGIFEYRTHLHFSLIYFGEGIENVVYTTNQGQFEQVVLLETQEDYARYADSVDHINRTDDVAWGYRPIGNRLVGDNSGKDSFVLQITLLADDEVSAPEAQQAFRGMIASTRIQVDITLSDGSRTYCTLCVGVNGAVEGDVTIGLESSVS